MVAAAKALLMLPSMQDPLQMLPATVLCAWVVTSIFQLQVPVPVANLFLDRPEWI
jgi:hypothetical protein